MSPFLRFFVDSAHERTRRTEYTASPNDFLGIEQAHEVGGCHAPHFHSLVDNGLGYVVAVAECFEHASCGDARNGHLAQFAAITFVGTHQFLGALANAGARGIVFEATLRGIIGYVRRLERHPAGGTHYIVVTVEHAAVNYYSGTYSCAHHHEDAVFATAPCALPEFAVDGATAVVVYIYFDVVVRVRIDDLCVKALSHYLFFLAGSLPNSRDRYVHIAAARFLANIDANSLDADYMTIELRYQHCLARFATDKEDPQALKFEVCDQYKELDSVKRHIQTIDCLKTYKKNCSATMSQFELQNLDDEERADMIESLIDSSNTLNGKISQPEINRIKKQITKLLGVDDLFVNTIPDITYYGEESDTLEFKSSAVYPPDNGGKPEPNRQLWTILKTICGFLNTLSGGELLLGVKDNGNSCGLADDLDYLYKSNKISECSMDKYRNYIKNAADAAFVDDMKIASEKEITTGRVNYFIEKNKEGHDILRIQIRPYEYGVVLFNSNRPEYVSDGYVRTSGATMSLTTEIKADIAKRKLNVAYDGNQRKLCLLRQACKNRKQVRLVNYSSGSGVRDRIVEPYLLVPLHKEFICYEAAAAGSHIRSFKISRMADVEVLNENWKYTSKHKHLKVDVFGMLEDVVNPPFEVKLKLDTLAYNLLLEEQPLAKNYVSENSDESDREQFPWLLCTSICKPEGVGRFYIGLSEHVKLEYGERLKTYVREKAMRLAAL